MFYSTMLFVIVGSSFQADEGESLSLISETNTATVGGLNPGAIYAFQVRARTERGYGSYSGNMYFQTLLGGKCPHASGVIHSLLNNARLLIIGLCYIAESSVIRKDKGSN